MHVVGVKYFTHTHTFAVYK